MKTSAKLTSAQYSRFQYAFDFFNRVLFGNELPQVLITMQRKAKSMGYFAPNRFNGRADSDTGESDAVTVHEIALNPDNFRNRPDREAMQTLVHEMCHLWQQACGTVPTKAYHDKQWAAKMLEVGLTPSDTGAAGGKTTGQKMSDYPTPGGVFLAAFTKLTGEGFKLDWHSVACDEKGSKTKKASSASKTKYTCPECDINAWAKPDTSLICGACYDTEGDIVTMEAQLAELAEAA